MSAILDTAANALTMLNFVPASYYSILQSEATTPSTPSTSGGSDSKKPLTAFYGQVCPGDIIEVKAETSQGELLVLRLSASASTLLGESECRLS